MGTACAVRHGKGACICARGALNSFIYPEHGRRTSVPPQKNSLIPAIPANKCHLKGAVAMMIPGKEGLKLDNIMRRSFSYLCCNDDSRKRRIEI